MCHTVCSQRDQLQVIKAGEITVWHGRQYLDFRMPERFRKLCLLVPADRFEGLLPDSKLHVGAHFKAGTNLSKLLGACLSTLSDNVLTSDEEPSDAAVEVTLDMLGAALTKNKESLDDNPRTNLFERIRVFIDKRLDGPDLSPSTIAHAHSISVRYLHLLFSQRGVTVGAWVRLRRLAQCRVALTDVRKDRTITEIAMKWGSATPPISAVRSKLPLASLLALSVVPRHRHWATLVHFLARESWLPVHVSASMASEVAEFSTGTIRISAPALTRAQFFKKQCAPIQAEHLLLRVGSIAADRLRCR
jgi:AraC-like DNA-binding protein